MVSHSPGYCSLSIFFFACSLLLFSRASFQRLFSIPGPLRHFLTRHFVRWTVSGQAVPPNCGSILIILVLIMWPFPHEVLHSDHWDHSVSSQSMAAKNEKYYTKSVLAANLNIRSRKNIQMCPMSFCILNTGMQLTPPAFSANFVRVHIKNVLKPSLAEIFFDAFPNFFFQGGAGRSLTLQQTCK